jgi:hypothetical protein
MQAEVALFAFRRENNRAARQERIDRAERRMAGALRRLSDLFRRAAELIEARRLERGGYHSPDRFLDRSDGPPRS